MFTATRQKILGEEEARETMNYKVHEYSGEFAITGKDGERLYADIFPILKAGGNVTLDFTGVRVFASPFFNAAIGSLLKEFRLEFVRRAIKFSNLSSVGEGVKEKVLRNAEEYYYRPEIRRALDQILKEANSGEDNADK